ncbi:uncharacterized protein LOC126845923 [Adelges cooleyi]|uniref:uncharacterized protein LOC126845923 n=1 Tax=Adelges cooleyi TaxID=133065 RepID=UPI0021804196|nr:uncharacterized protein LOC126845923 [Adelges cooleyi]
MDNSKVKYTFICGASEYTKSILFESAVYWSELGLKVVFIQISQMSALPFPIDGASPPSVQALNRITFLTLSRWQDVIHYTSSIHEAYPNVPRVILVSDLHDYYSDVNDDNNQIMLAHMLCANLRDAITYTSRVCDCESYLIISAQDTLLETEKLSTMYFPSGTWLAKVIDSKVEVVKKLLYPQNSNYKITFSLLNNKIRCDTVEMLYR